MCVIIIKESGVKMPSFDILYSAFKRNHDGCGFATPTRLFHTMDFFEFYRELVKVKRNEPCIIHFRYATHGSICERNCHPFYNGATDTAFMHNGILSIKPIGDMTDSETAFKKYIVPQIKKYGFFSKEVDNVVNNIIGSSKFAMLQGENIRRFGHFECIDGVYYSNLYFMPMTRRWREYEFAV